MTVKRRIYWGWVAVTVGLYAALVGWAGPRFSEMAGGLQPFDLRVGGYEVSGALEFLAALDTDAAAFYLNIWYPLDMVFLSFITVAMAVGLFWLYRHWQPLARFTVAAVPIAYGAFDVLENNAVAGMVKGGAETLIAQTVEFSSLMTQLKFVFFFLSVLLIAAGLISAWQNRRNTA